MVKSSATERNKRINFAISLLKKHISSTQVISELQRRFGISKRQAYRYVREAGYAKEMLPVPEQKIVFTVKIPKSLAQRIRDFARSTGQSVSDVVTRALENVLSHGEGNG